jgi:RHS repeat-associated protein
MQYDSFGNLLEVRGDVVRLPLGFAGGLFDADTGLTRFVWRDYDADTGRFTALDPLGKKGGDSDWYGYCVDDPVNRVDVWGLEWDTLLEDDPLSGLEPLEVPGDSSPAPDSDSVQVEVASDFPTYGNWGGPDYSGGVHPSENGGQDGTAPPVDSADEKYMKHDKAWGRCDNEDILANDPTAWRKQCRREADKDLTNELKGLSNDPKNWPKPPTTESEWKAKTYRKGAILWF